MTRFCYTAAAAGLRRKTDKTRSRDSHFGRGASLVALFATAALLVASTAHAGGFKSFGRSGGGGSRSRSTNSFKLSGPKISNSAGNMKFQKFNISPSRNAVPQKSENQLSVRKTLKLKSLGNPSQLRRDNPLVNKSLGGNIVKPVLEHLPTKSKFEVNKNLIDSVKIGRGISRDKSANSGGKIKLGDIVNKKLVNKKFSDKTFVDKKFNGEKIFDKHNHHKHGGKFKNHCDWNWCSKKSCRFTCYKPCKVWHCWDYPRWIGLHRHRCGVWYDVPTVAIRQGVDLQLLAVRFVDSGDAQENAGPRYRVWVRNNSPILIDKSFNVVLMVGPDAAPSAGLPQAGVQIDSIAPGQILPIDVRLPIEANQQGLAMLHVLVDSHREIIEVYENNNGTVVSRSEVPPVELALVAAASEAAPAGGEFDLAGEGLGTQPGRAIVRVGGLDLEAEVIGWSELGLRIRLPELPLASPVAGEVFVVRADGAASEPLGLTLVPAQAVAATAGSMGPGGPLMLRDAVQAPAAVEQ